MTDHRERDDAIEPTVRGVLADALAIYRLHTARVALSAAPVFALVGAAGLVVHSLEERLHGDAGADRIVVLLALVVGAGLVRSLGTVVYAGFLDEVVGASLDGRPLPSTAEALRVLPLGRLIVADVVTTIAIGVATGLAVVPGLALFTLLGIVGPVINIERHGVASAIRRSVSLVRRRFWTSAALLVPLLLLEHAVETWFVLAVEGTPLLASIGFGVVIGLTVGAALGLVEVVLAHRLIRRDRALARAT
jgi:hypothetical protein